MSEAEKKSNFTARKQKSLSWKQIQSETGKVPPQAIELEEAVLGALMLDKDALTVVIDILSEESFYKEAHQKIYSGILSLFHKSDPIDQLTVVTELRARGELEFVGGAFYIAQLTDKVGSAANIEYHARIISQKFIQRQLIKLSSEIIKDAFDETTDVFSLLDSAEQKLFQVAEGNIRKDYDSMSSIILQAKEQIRQAGEKSKLGVSGIPSGFIELDKLTSGWQPADLLILAARPGMGKTAFVLSMARNMAVDHKIPTAVFSLEMSSLQMVMRMVAMETELSSEKLKKGNLARHEWEQLNTKIGALAEAPVFIDDTPGLSVFELRAKARRLKAQHDIKMIIIDYLQLMTVGGNQDGKGNREQEISTISRSLKGIAKELEVPVIALSQLSRAVETRGGDKRPQLSDLRESGAIEQDADMVMFIYRPEYYGITQDENGNPLMGMGYIIVAKHRNGALADVALRYISHLTRFANLDIDEYSTAVEDKPPGGDAPDAMNGFNNDSNDGGGNAQIIQSKMNDDMGFDDDIPF